MEDHYSAFQKVMINSNDISREANHVICWHSCLAGSSSELDVAEGSGYLAWDISLIVVIVFIARTN
jgi:hypothetical protein